jgi:hypothetical protein
MLFAVRKLENLSNDQRASSSEPERVVPIGCPKTGQAGNP